MAAVAVSALPDTVGWVASLFGSASERRFLGGFFAVPRCDGFDLWVDVALSPWYLRLSTMPYLIVVPAFLVWLVVRRRAVGWVAAGVLGPVMAFEPVLVGYDAARWGSACVDMWLFPSTRWQVTSWTHGLVPVVLILLATYRPGYGAFRVVSGTVAIGLVLSAASDAPRPVITSADDCKDARRVDVSDLATLASRVNALSMRERRLAYVCAIRGLPDPRMIGTERPTEDGPLSDAVLLNQGRLACSGGKQMSMRVLVRHGVQWPTLEQIAYLCPERAVAPARARAVGCGRSTGV
ncbi:hypothetical protein [Actinomadura sp. 3N508]|uniref:hypothetical protein n=1 Tax=Actinomadura sp. 3N508 TaxID=3375153 RepID=UPI00378855A1